VQSGIASRLKIERLKECDFKPQPDRAFMGRWRFVWFIIAEAIKNQKRAGYGSRLSRACTGKILRKQLMEKVQRETFRFRKGYPQSWCSDRGVSRRPYFGRKRENAASA
jgi:hypothetical protein